jgi:hypothetical protein
MRKAFVLTICVVGLLAGSVQAQQPIYGNYNQPLVVNRGGLIMTVAPPYSAFGTSVPGYAGNIGYSFAYFARGFPPPGYTPQAEARAYAATQYMPYNTPYSYYGRPYYYNPGGPVSYSSR